MKMENDITRLHPNNASTSCNYHVSVSVLTLELLFLPPSLSFPLRPLSPSSSVLSPSTTTHTFSLSHTHRNTHTQTSTHTLERAPTHERARAHTHTQHTHARSHSHTHTHTHTHTQTHRHTRTHARTHARTHTQPSQVVTTQREEPFCTQLEPCQAARGLEL